MDSIQQLPYVASNGKTYQMDFTDDKGLYLIAQHLRVTKERPVLSEIKHFLARAGVFADKARRDPEGAAAEFQRVADENEYHKMRAEGFEHDEAIEWLDVRQKLKEQHLITTRVWKVRGISNRTDYAFLTNQIHRVALGRTATHHKRELAIKDSPRNYISAADNAAIQITEFTAVLAHNFNNSYGRQELSEDIEDISPIIDAARPEIKKFFSQKPRRLPGDQRPKIAD
jgi:hypothetical protein